MTPRGVLLDPPTRQERTLDEQARLDLLNRYHRIFAEFLTLDGCEPDTPLGVLVRKSAHRVKMYLIDGVQDYEHYQLWLACSAAVNRLDVTPDA